jgi:lysophospholipase L1-like esterase
VTLRVACLGDSITRALFSFDYLELVRRRHGPEALTMARFGVNGDFAFNLLQRLEPVLAQPFDVITVLIGTNDARASLAGYPVQRVMKRKRLPRRPHAAWFQECLSAVVERLRERSGATIGLLSLPVLGQDVDAPPAQASQAFSHRIAEVATAHRVAYLPVHERQLEALRRARVAPVPYREVTAAGIIGTLLQIKVLHRSLDAIARDRGLELTTDHIHQNSRGAAHIADALAESGLLGSCG